MIVILKFSKSFVPFNTNLMVFAAHLIFLVNFIQVVIICFWFLSYDSYESCDSSRFKQTICFTKLMTLLMQNNNSNLIIIWKWQFFSLKMTICFIFFELSHVTYLTTQKFKAHGDLLPERGGRPKLLWEKLTTWQTLPHKVCKSYFIFKENCSTYCLLDA